MKFIFAIVLLSISSSAVLAASATEKTCGLNERWSDCGTACPVHCPIRNTRTGELEDGSRQACILVCKQGCQCQPGFVRDLKRNGACVEKFSCSPADEVVKSDKVEESVIAEEPQEQTCTRANEVFLSCGTACPESCPFRDAKTGLLHDGTHPICNKMCKVGCACAHGFVRDLKRDGACVQRSLCSAP